MRNRNMLLTTVTLTLIAGLISFGISCDDDDDTIVEPNPDEFYTIGIQIREAATPLVTYDETDYNRFDSLARKDTIFASLGSNPRWSTMFLDDDGSLFEAPEEEELTLDIDISDTSIAEIEWPGGDEGVFEFILEGKKRGETRITFTVMDDGTVDFQTLPMPLVIGEVVSQGEIIYYELIDSIGGLVLTSWVADSNRISGFIDFDSGAVSQQYELLFYDETGTDFTPDSPPYSLSLSNSDPAIIEILDDSPDNPWGFRIQAVDEGTADLTVRIMLDGSVHTEFTPMPVVVQQ